MKKLLTLLVVTLLAGLFFVCPAQATTYYVATGGSNASIGDITHPWASVSHAIGVVVADDIVYVRGGTYNDTIREQAVTFHSGTLNHPITISGYAGETAIENVNFDNVIEIETAQYLVFQDMTLNATTGLTWSGPSNCTNGITNNGSHNVFQRLVINGPIVGHASPATIRGHGVLTGENSTGNTYKDITTSFFSEHGVYEDGDNNTWDHLVSHDNGYGGSCNGSAGAGHGIQINCSSCDPNADIIKNSVLYDNAGSGIVINGNDALVYNNIAYGNVSYQIQIGVPGSCCRNNAQVYNNTVADSNFGLHNTDGSDSALIKNNIVWNMALSGFADDGSYTDPLSGQGFNLCTGSASCAQTTNPLFTNAGAHDYTLQSGSPAQATGTNLSAFFSTDFNGAARGVTWDMGAYVLNGGGGGGGGFGRTSIATESFTNSGADACIASWSANWTVLYDSASCALVVLASSDTVVGYPHNDQPWVARWSGAGSFTNDQYASIAITTTPVDTDGDGSTMLGVVCRASADVDINRDYYYAIQYAYLGVQYFSIGKLVNGSLTALGYTSAVAWTVGDRIECEVSGTTVRGLQNGTVLMSVTDTSISTGKPGVGGAGNSGIVDAAGDNWVGGALTASGTVIPIRVYLTRRSN